MGRYLNPGNEAFKISVSSEIYVDKSNLISFTNKRLEQEKRYICVSRPRRFGKSMTANMLCAYYDKSCNSKDLFHHLNIFQNEKFEQYLNQYDVIFLNIQHFLRKAGSPENLANYIEEKVLAEIRKVYGNLIDETETSLPDALASVFEQKDQSNRGFIFIIDEWDCIFRENKDNKQAHKYYLDFLKDLFKDRTYVKLAYMTGILPIKKYGTHSALNIFDEFSMTSPKHLAQYVGFTEEEVKELCTIYHMNFSEAQRWYDGYQFKNIKHIYNPKSIVDAMIDEEFKSYWNNTETYEALKVYIDMNFDGLKDAIIAMLGNINCQIDIGTFQNDMTNFLGKDDVLTLLIHLGYLAYNETTRTVFIPNEEVREEFLRVIRTSGWNEVIRAISHSERLLAEIL
ncbi:MAG TPA: AAA family ATPase [Candidatus Fimimorpha faecalis]|uniref:AAA family ATPase n=1 Tax=Candidatus Fimimorpha faecalis TaxID=2840824 RepID=A0A9D1EGX7_9FIRM|nr:AAA family ATPase [Candidatus Fimimorpha faecalis]